MRVFEEFPENHKCLICKTSYNMQCVLVAIDGTLVDGNEQATPVHLQCLINLSFRIAEGDYIIYANI